MKQEQFKHSPLISVDHIRLLQIDSVSETKIKCSITQCHINDAGSAPGYLALSYCWGSSVLDRTITISDSPFAVTSNLFAALQTINRCFKGNGNVALGDFRWLWIDAISINQQDNGEKSAQVQKMDQIYSKANRVLIWLGEERDESEKIMLMLSYLFWDIGSGKFACRNRTSRESPVPTFDSRSRYRLAQQEHLVQILEKKYNIEGDTIKAIVEVLGMLHDCESHEGQFNLSQGQYSKSLPVREDVFWSHLFRFMTRSWFQRIWTYQEVLLATDAVVLCGDYEVPWEIVEMVRRLIFNEKYVDVIYSGMALKAEPDDEQDHQAFGATEELFFNAQYEYSRSDIETRPQYALHHLLKQLTLASVCLATEPRDYIYGRRALWSQELQSRLPIDYSLPVSDVFVSAVQLADGAKGGAYFLCHLLRCSHRFVKAEHLNLPSWCPDFSCRETQTNVGGMHNTDDYVSAKVAIKGPGTISFKDKRTVCIAGLDLGTIARVSNTKTWEGMPRAHKELAKRGRKSFQAYMSVLTEWLHEMADLFDRATDRSPDLFSRWLEGFLFTDYLKPSTNHHSLFQDILDFVELLQNPEHKKSLSYEDAHLRLGKPPEVIKRLVEIAMHVFATKTSLFFFCTTDDKIGFASRPVKPGQRICYLDASYILHVLSDECDEHIAIAEMEGLGGDGILGHLQDGKTWETFTLH